MKKKAILYETKYSFSDHRLGFNSVSERKDGVKVMIIDGDFLKQVNE